MCTHYFDIRYDFRPIASFFNTRKSLHGHAKKSVTSLLLEQIKLSVAGNGRQKQGTNEQNFALTFQAGSEKLAKKTSKGLPFFATPCRNSQTIVNCNST